jgi:hypothetical protein
VILEVTKKPTTVLERFAQLVTGAKTEVPKFPVVFHPSANVVGKSLQILNYQLQPLGEPIAAHHEFKLELEGGLYLARIEGVDTPQVFEVSGVGGVLDVRL